MQPIVALFFYEEILCIFGTLNTKDMSFNKALFLAFAVIVLDQISKIYIKTHFAIDDFIKVMGFDWFQIRFIENDGMAWGVEIPGNYGKLLLTTFRIFAVAGIIWWLKDSVKKKANTILIVSIALILAGAIGNILDSVFYGVIFDHSHHQIATLFSDQPYGEWFHGKVVDMFYFPIWEGYFPEWLPIWGGNYFRFFNAIFNVADVAISLGVILLILFNKKAFK